MGLKQALFAVRRAWMGDPAIPPNVSIGSGVYIGPGVQLDWSFGHLISIGDDATIVSGVRVLCHDAASKRRTGLTWCAPVSIGARAYVGADAVILPGVSIGEDAIVAAGAVVTADVDSGAVVAGVPARRISSTTDLDARREALAATRPTFGADYHGSRLPADRVEALREAGRAGGYFLR